MKWNKKEVITTNSVMVKFNSFFKLDNLIFNKRLYQFKFFPSGFIFMNFNFVNLIDLNIL